MYIYLYDHYKNKYRVRPKLDRITKDFPRDENGDIDQSFQDFYIKCKNDFELTYYDQNILEIYNENPIKGNNLLRQLYIDKISPDLPKSFDNIVKRLQSQSLIIDTFYTSSDFICRINSDLLDTFAVYLKPETRGSSIAPLSNKNLPKDIYVIPDKDLEEYQDIIDGLDMHPLEKARLLKTINEQYKNNQGFSDKLKQSKLPFKEYLHREGYWKKYLKYLKGELANV